MRFHRTGAKIPGYVRRSHNIFGFMIALGLATFTTLPSNAALVSSNIGVGGTFNATLTGGGTARLNSASGTLRQWLGFFHTNIGISANAQTVGLSVPTVNPGTMSAGGNVNMTYDNLTPGTPNSINSVNVDLNGNTNIPVTVNVAPVAIQIAGFANANVVLTVNGTITDVDFASTGTSPVSGGNPGTFSVPGNFLASFQGNVTGTVTNLPLGLGNINLGTLTTITPTTLTVPGSLTGTATTSDIQGGASPFPNDMLANFAATLASVSVPLSIPFNIDLTQTNPPSGQSRLIRLVASGSINANLNLNSPTYNVNGTVNAALVPEPSSGLLVISVSLASIVLRRRR